MIMMPNTQGLAVTHDVDMPQCGFDDVEGADVAFLDHVVRAKYPPAPSEYAGTALLIPQEAHLPWLEAMILVRSSPECDIGGHAQPDRLAEIRRNILQ